MDVTRWCGGCVAETAFVRFDCSEHRAGCQELVCVACGAGVELAPHQVETLAHRCGREVAARVPAA